MRGLTSVHCDNGGSLVVKNCLEWSLFELYLGYTSIIVSLAMVYIIVYLICNKFWRKTALLNDFWFINTCCNECIKMNQK